MATVTYDKTTLTATVVLSAKEGAIYQAANKLVSGNPLKQLIEGWLSDMQGKLNAQDLKAIQARLAAATDADIAAVKTALGL